MLGEKDDIYAEAYKEGEVLNSEILNEMVDISFENSHESSFQSSFEDQFDSMQGELHFRHPLMVSKWLSILKFVMLFMIQ